MLEQRYEDLIADPQAASRALIAHCELPWDDACLNFQTTERNVRRRVAGRCASRSTRRRSAAGGTTSDTWSRCAVCSIAGQSLLSLREIHEA